MNFAIEKCILSLYKYFIYFYIEIVSYLRFFFFQRLNNQILLLRLYNTDTNSKRIIYVNTNLICKNLYGNETKIIDYITTYVDVKNNNTKNTLLEVKSTNDQEIITTIIPSDEFIKMVKYFNMNFFDIMFLICKSYATTNKNDILDVTIQNINITKEFKETFHSFLLFNIWTYMYVNYLRIHNEKKFNKITPKSPHITITDNNLDEHIFKGNEIVKY